MKSGKLFLFASLFSSSVLFAQNDDDALRYSMLTFGGSARSMGMGGAFGALGADLSTLSTNPAGLGFYRKNEILFTPGLVTSRTETDFLGSTTPQTKYNFNLTNAGIALTGKLGHTYRSDEEKTPEWKSIAFGFAVNRLANFSSRFSYSGFNPDNSLLDSYLQKINSGAGIEPTNLTDAFPFDAGLAYQAYLINPISGDSMHYNSVIPSGNIQQDFSKTSTGGLTEYALSLAANYDDHLFIGGTIGLPVIHYHSSSTYSESDKNDSIPDFINYVLTNDTRTSGEGVNVKFGLIYRVNDNFRLGVAAHSPTFYSMRDNYSSAITSDFSSSGKIESSSPDGKFNYTLSTPWRLIGSMAFVFPNYGLISVDYEWLDYSQANFAFDQSGNSGDQSIASAINQTIEKKYTAAANLRVGGELSLGIFRVRAGFGTAATPFTGNYATPNASYAVKNISAGLGVREKNYFIDLGYVYSATNRFYQPYALTSPVEFVPGASSSLNMSNMVMTVGWKF